MREQDILVIVQARMGSNRLPGKVLLDIEGKPLLFRMYERVARANSPAKIVVATSTESEDDQIEELCKRENIEIFRGHETDLLDRHYKAAQYYGSRVVAKIPSDCPLIDPAIIDEVFREFFRSDSDYCSNLHPATYPDGNDVEIFTTEILKEAWMRATRSYEREHTTPYIWERPHAFRISNVEWKHRDGGNEKKDLSMSHRWTVDYPEDYRFVQRVYQELLIKKRDFGLYDILELLEDNPDLHQINTTYAGVNWYRHHLFELRTISSHETRSLDQ